MNIINSLKIVGIFILVNGYAECGSSPSNSSTFIVGGHKAIRGEVPYQLRLYYENEHYCGASLINVDGLQVAVTAAHCTNNFNQTQYTLKAGELNRNDVSGHEQTRQVVSIVSHQNYSQVALPFDISLIFITSSFELNEDVQTIPLPMQGQITSTGNVTVSGWGKLYWNGPFSEDLQVADIPVVNDTACQAAYENYHQHVQDSMLCAGGPTGNIYPCQGDSGGPAKSDAGYLVGITSWGYECGHPDYPAVFTKVSYYVDWITEIVSLYKQGRM